MNHPPYRILFLSRDRGSVQAILPLVHFFKDDPRFLITAVSMNVSRTLFNGLNISTDALDETLFLRDPKGCIGTLLDRYQPDLILSGSSPAKGPSPETPEQYSIIEARHRGLVTMAVLDYWGMYHERFVTDGYKADASLVPDRLCVMDRRCRDDLIALGVPEDRIVITHNPWMDEVVRTAARLPEKRQRNATVGWQILYVSQPIAETAAVRSWLHTQETLLGLMISALPPAGPGRQHQVMVWQHPAEDSERWKDLSAFQREDVKTMISYDRGAGVLTGVDCVASSHSTVTYEALYYGTPCLSLRMMNTEIPPLVTDELGLSIPLTSTAEITSFFASTTPDSLRLRLQTRREELLHQGLFFSDGGATLRVRQEIERMLLNPHLERVS